MNLDELKRMVGEKGGTFEPREFVRDLAARDAALPAIALGIAGLGYAAGSRRVLWALPALGAIAAGVRLRGGRQVQQAANEKLVEKAVEQAEIGRKLAIYERETGLLAYWFVALRCDEECARSRRYGGPLSLLVADGASKSADDVRAAARAMTAALRSVDIVSYAGRARFIAVLPNTAEENLGGVRERLGSAGFSQVATASCPADGRNFDELYKCAAEDLASRETTAVKPDRRWREAA